MERTQKRQFTSCSLFLVIFALLNTEITARRKRKSLFQFEDCGTEDKIIHFDNFRVYPVPVFIPGTVYVSVAGNVTADLPRRVNVYLTIWKYFYSFPIRVPCFSDGVGSCSYENICATLEQFERTGCPLPLRYQGIPCTCPFLAGEFIMNNVAFDLPRIEGFSSSLLKGKYELEMVVQEEDGPELGCLRVNFNIKRRRRKRT